MVLVIIKFLLIHFFKTAPKMDASDPSHFAEFKQVKKLVVILWTLNKSKN